MNTMKTNVHWRIIDAALKAMAGADTITTDHYWDCECATDYIHPKAEPTCSLCGANAQDAPSARLREVILMLIEEAEATRK